MGSYCVHQTYLISECTFDPGHQPSSVFFKLWASLEAESATDVLEKLSNVSQQAPERNSTRQKHDCIFKTLIGLVQKSDQTFVMND